MRSHGNWLRNGSRTKRSTILPQCATRCAVIVRCRVSTTLFVVTTAACARGAVAVTLSTAAVSGAPAVVRGSRGPGVALLARVSGPTRRAVHTCCGYAAPRRRGSASRRTWSAAKPPTGRGAPGRVQGSTGAQAGSQQQPIAPARIAGATGALPIRRRRRTMSMPRPHPEVVPFEPDAGFVNVGYYTWLHNRKAWREAAAAAGRSARCVRRGDVAWWPRLVAALAG